MKEYERKQLLERIERDGATVGTQLPETVEVGGEPLELRDFVFEIKRREGDGIDAATQERVEAAKRSLRGARLARKREIEAGEIAFERGETLAAEIVGIDRALNALAQLGPTDLEAETQAKSAADDKRWLRFLKQVTGGVDDRGVER